MSTFRAYAANKSGASFEPFEYNAGGLEDDQVQIKVTSCGICHSDLSMLDNDWGMTEYPFVGGHEIVGTIEKLGSSISHLNVGETVGLGWFSRSCTHCRTCMRGDHNLCPTAEGTIVKRHGGFADRVRCHWSWATPIPEGVDPASAGPLFCGGITVFNPIVQCGVQPTDRVGVVGIGGLGHMALGFLNAWGCEVTAFTSSPSKADEARSLGAHRVVSSRDDTELDAIAGQLDFLISTVNVPLNWDKMITALGPRGRLHFVGAVPEPVPVTVFSLLTGQKSISGSPLGSPATTADMLDFCGRHAIKPVTEHFPMSQINEAFDRLRSGKARYRIVLDADFD